MDLVRLLNKASNDFSRFGSIGNTQEANNLFKLIMPAILDLIAGAAFNNDKALLGIIGAGLHSSLSAWCGDSMLRDGTLLSDYLNNKFLGSLSKASINGRSTSEQQHSLIREAFPVLEDRLHICKVFGIGPLDHSYYTNALTMDSKLACSLLLRGAPLTNTADLLAQFQQNAMFEVIMATFRPGLLDVRLLGDVPELRAAVMFGVDYLQAGFFDRLPIEDYAALIHGEKPVTEYRLEHISSFMQKLRQASTGDELLSLQRELTTGLVNELTGQPYPFETAADRLSYLLSDAAITRELAKRFDGLCEQWLAKSDDEINAGAESLFSALQSFFLRYQTVGLAKVPIGELSEVEQRDFFERARKLTGVFCFDLSLPHMNQFFIRYMQLTKEQYQRRPGRVRDEDLYYFVSRAYPRRSSVELFAEPLMDTGTLSLLTDIYGLNCYIDNINLAGRPIMQSIAECVYSLRKSAPERLSFIPHRLERKPLSVEQLLVQQFAAKSVLTTAYLSDLYESALDDLHSREHNSALGDTFGRVMSQAPGAGPEFLNDMLRPTMV